MKAVARLICRSRFRPEFIETVRRFLGVGLSIPAVSQPAAVGPAASSPQHRRAPRRRPRKTTEIADQWAQARLRRRGERPHAAPRSVTNSRRLASSIGPLRNRLRLTEICGRRS